MQNKAFWWAVGILAVAALAGGSGVQAQVPKEDMRFSGTINDFTPANVPVTVTGPWEVRGHWSLIVKANGKAEFVAALTMARSDQGVLMNGTKDLDDPTDRNAHTHHITLVGAEVTAIPNATTGFRVTGGVVTITANGNNPPPFGAVSTLQIDITGGNTVTFSNVAVTLGGDAAGHFGAAPMHGVVRVARRTE
jgi:hypothetical protein